MMDPCLKRARPLGCVTKDQLMPKGECRVGIERIVGRGIQR